MNNNHFVARINWDHMQIESMLITDCDSEADSAYEEKAASIDGGGVILGKWEWTNQAGAFRETRREYPGPSVSVIIGKAIHAHASGQVLPG